MMSTSSRFSVVTWHKVAAFGLLLAVLAAAFLPVVQAATVGAPQLASDDSGNAIVPKVAQDPQGNVHVVWGAGDSSRSVRYAKGTWNASSNSYTFGASALIADVGSFQYATPSVAVAPNGTIAVVWSDGNIKIRAWDSKAAQPSGVVNDLGSGIQASVAAGPNNLIQVAWNGNFQVQYCEWNGLICAKRVSYGEGQGNRPDIAVDRANNVHIVSDAGQSTIYRARAAGGEFGAQETLGGGNFAQIAADGQGNVHIVRSEGLNIQYCQRKFGQPCTDQKVFSYRDDLQPSIGATQGGSVLVVFRDAGEKKLVYNVRENGTWSATSDFANASTIPDVTARPYSSRFSLVWSQDFAAQLVTVRVADNPCDNRVLSVPSESEWVGPMIIPANGRYLPMVSGGPSGSGGTPAPTPPSGCTIN